MPAMGLETENSPIRRKVTPLSDYSMANRVRVLPAMYFMSRA